MPNLFETKLIDFPKSEIWRLQTDGWQQNRGPKDYKEAYYKGLDQGFNFISKHIDDRVTPEMIEGIYQSAYKFEADLRIQAAVKEAKEKGLEEEDVEEVTQLKGYRDKSAASFEVFFPVPGIEYDAGISKEGIPEFIENLKSAFESTPKKRWALHIEDRSQLTSSDKSFTREDGTSMGPEELREAMGGSLNLKKTLDTVSVKKTGSQYFDIYPDLKGEYKGENLGEWLSKKLTEAGEDYSAERRKEFIAGTKVTIRALPISREQMFTFIKDAAQIYEKEIAAIEKDNKNIEDEKIAAIVKLIRKLHQTHCFPDGNGRTFIHLLLKKLLVQNGMDLMITYSPAHFAGFSVQQLINEVKKGMAKYQEFKITNARVFLEALSADKVLEKDTKILLNEQLSKDPLIALAQINDLFLKIQADIIQVPHGFNSKSFLKLFTPKKNGIAHGAVLQLLQDLYLEKVAHLVSNPSENINEKIVSEAALMDILDRHAIHDPKKNLEMHKKIESEVPKYFSAKKIIEEKPLFKG